MFSGGSESWPIEVQGEWSQYEDDKKKRSGIWMYANAAY